MEEYFQAKLALFQPDRAKRGVVSLDTAYGARVVAESAHPGDDDRDRRPLRRGRRRRLGRRDPRRDRGRTPSSASTGPDGRVARDARAAASAGTWPPTPRSRSSCSSRRASSSRRSAQRSTPDGGIQRLPARPHRAGLRRPRARASTSTSATAPTRSRTPSPPCASSRRAALIMVFGADGDRDATKRHDMGRVAAEGSRRPRHHRPPPALRGPGVDPRDPARGRRRGRRISREIYEVSPPEAAIRRPSRSRARATRSCGPGPGHQDYRDIARRAHAVLRPRAGARRPARGGLGVIALGSPNSQRRSADACVLRRRATRRRLIVDGSVETDSRAGLAGLDLLRHARRGDRRAPVRVRRGRRRRRPRRRRARTRPRRSASSSSPTASRPSPPSRGRSSHGCARSAALRIVGITGSNGKTTTKNLLRAILEAEGPTVAPQGSFNNQVGAPITMLRVDERHRVPHRRDGRERRRRDRPPRRRSRRPDVGVVLKVGLAHAGEFGGIEATAAREGRAGHRPARGRRRRAQRRRSARRHHGRADRAPGSCASA